jgi:glucosyl-3-phosphoglycerate synthase
MRRRIIREYTLNKEVEQERPFLLFYPLPGMFISRNIGSYCSEMADFHQSSGITTLHRLNRKDARQLERDLERHAGTSSIGLVLPALYTEFERPAMRRIVSELRQVRFLKHIVVALGRANADQYAVAQSFFDDFQTPVTVLWIDSDPVQRVLQLIASEGFPVSEDGKGRSCWLACGYLLADGACDVIALHDCDIVNYDRDILVRLCYPIANPKLDFSFAKGYYARVAGLMNGRVTRLFMTPMLRALDSLVPGAPFLQFLLGFRYLLAGEFAFKSTLARVNRLPSDWGLEVGALAEIYKNVPASGICQVDIADAYEHKHQILSKDDPTTGLCRMAREVGKSLFRSIAAEGIVLNRDLLRTLQVRYPRFAEQAIEQSYADATMNALRFDRRGEQLAVATFESSLRAAISEFIDDSIHPQPIPNWNTVLAAIPEVFDLLQDAAIHGQERKVVYS